MFLPVSLTAYELVEFMFALLMMLYSAIFPSSQESLQSIAMLGDRSFHVRQRASENLVALGARAIPSIESAIAKYDGSDLEVLFRLKDARERILYYGPVDGELPPIYCLCGPKKGWYNIQKQIWIEPEPLEMHNFRTVEGREFAKELISALTMNDWTMYFLDKRPIGTEPNPKIIYAMVCHKYYAALLRDDEGTYWPGPDGIGREVRATHVLCRDLMRAGVPASTIRSMIAEMRLRSNPWPVVMPDPPAKLRAWATRYCEEIPEKD